MQPGMLWPDAGIIQTCGYREPFEDLTIVVLQQVGAVAMQHAGATASQGRTMLHLVVDAFAACLNPDDIDLFVGHEIIGINTRHRVRFIPLFQEREAWYVRPDHPLRGKANIADKAKDYPLVKVTPDHARHGDVLTEEGAELFTVAAQNTQVTYELDSLSASIDMVKMSNAIMPYTSEMEAYFVNQGLALLWLNKEQLGQVGIYTKVGDFTKPTQALIDLIIKKAES